MAPSSPAAETLLDHIQGFVERPHPAFRGQPVCPFARRARTNDRVEIVVVPFAADDDASVTWALSRFDATNKDVMLVVHPDPKGLTYFALAEIRDRFAERFAGLYDVFTGHPDDPYTRAGVKTRREPFPVLHFVISERLRDAERRLGPGRSLLAKG